MDQKLRIKKIVSLAAGGRRLLPKGVILEAGSPKFLRPLRKILAVFFYLAVFYPTNLTALTTQCGLAGLGSGPGPKGPAKKEWTLELKDCPAPQQECCWINRPAGSQTGYTHDNHDVKAICSRYERPDKSKDSFLDDFFQVSLTYLP